MKTTASLPLIALLFSLVACSKKDIPNDVPVFDKVKTYTETVNSSVLGQFSTTYTISYDQEGRFLSMIDSQNPGNKFMFTHNPSGFDLDIFAKSNVVIHQDVFLNDILMDSTIQFNDEGDTTTEKYIYNTDKLLVKLKRYNYHTSGSILDEEINYTYDADRNLLTETDYSSTITYTYNNEVILNTIDLFPINFTHSRRLPSRVTYSGDDVTVDHTYAVDGQKRLIRDHAVVSNGDEFTKTYTYE